MSLAPETISRADVGQQKESVSTAQLVDAYVEAIKERHKRLPVLPKFRVLQKMRLDLDKEEGVRTDWDEKNLKEAKVIAKSFWMTVNGKARVKPLEFEKNDSMFVNGVLAGLDREIDDCGKKLMGSGDDVERKSWFDLCVIVFNTLKIKTKALVSRTSKAASQNR